MNGQLAGQPVHADQHGREQGQGGYCLQSDVFTAKRDFVLNFRQHI